MMYNKLVQVGVSDNSLLNASKAYSKGVSPVILLDELDETLPNYVIQVLIDDVNKAIVGQHKTYKLAIRKLPKWCIDFIAALYYSMNNYKSLYVNNDIWIKYLPDIDSSGVFFTKMKNSNTLVSCDIIHPGSANQGIMLDLYHTVIDDVLRNISFYNMVPKNIFNIVANKVARRSDIRQISRGCING